MGVIVGGLDEEDCFGGVGLRLGTAGFDGPRMTGSFPKLGTWDHSVAFPFESRGIQADWRMSRRVGSTNSSRLKITPDIQIQYMYVATYMVVY